MSSNVAKYFKLKNKGKLSSGYDSDFTLINLWNGQIVFGNKMHSKGKYTPFEGKSFDAKVEMTFLRGQLIINNEKIISKEKTGKFIRV